MPQAVEVTERVSIPYAAYILTSRALRWMLRGDVATGWIL